MSNTQQHTKDIRQSGRPLDGASRVLILLHGRGGSAEDILGLARHLYVDGFTLLAPQATNHTWYPYSFLMPHKANEPWLSSALENVHAVMDEVVKAGVKKEHIYFAGFSQGACLMLEYLARHADGYGGAAAFTGGLIGEKPDLAAYKGNFDGMPVYIGTSDPDPHVPVERVKLTKEVLEKMGAKVTEKIYPGMGHTITKEEIDEANKTIFRRTAGSQN
jgi:phospholipase/carboxylesterase